MPDVGKYVAKEDEVLKVVAQVLVDVVSVFLLPDGRNAVPLEARPDKTALLKKFDVLIDILFEGLKGQCMPFFFVLKHVVQKPNGHLRTAR